MITIDISKSGKGRHRRYIFEIWLDDENCIVIRKKPKGARIQIDLFIEDYADPHQLSSLLHVSSIICTLIGLHLDFVQIHHALESIDDVQVNAIRFVENYA